MKYTSANLKRILIVEFEHGDDLIERLIALVKKENILGGVILLLGAMKQAAIIVGPEKISILPVPIWKNFDDGREILGVGTIFWKENEPKIHIHAGFGRKDDVLLGCVRKDTKVYLVVECVLFEFDKKTEKKFNSEMGIDVINFE
ncbi:MAG: DNA-binding protein [Candidatus Altarchaeum sp.]|nr:DNA-binding protein [Candidatus Altarchaeum sp.]